jgi:hypothetical protein
MGDNKAMLDVMKSLDKKIKSTKKNTPKQVSYLVRFNTTEEDFTKEREEIFKAQLSAFMRDNIPMDIPEIIPYERKPISLEKEKIEKENDLPPVYAGHSRTPVITIEHMGELPSKGTPNTIYCIRNDKCSPWSWVEGEGAYYLLGINTTIETETKGTIRPYEITDYNAKRYNEEASRKGATFADKTKVDLMSAKDIRLAELCSEYNDGSIGKSEYVEKSIQTLMSATDPVIVNHDGDIFAGTLEYDLSKDYEYRIYRIKPRVDIHDSKLYHALRIELVPKSVLAKIFSPWKKKMWDVEIAIHNASTLKKYPIDSLSLVNFPYDWYGKTDIFGNNILNTFIKLIFNVSLNVNKSQKYTLWDHIDDLI